MVNTSKWHVLLVNYKFVYLMSTGVRIGSRICVATTNWSKNSSLSRFASLDNV